MTKIQKGSEWMVLTAFWVTCSGEVWSGLRRQDMQNYAREQIKAETGKDIERPLNFVFHGGSGSEKHHITTV